LFYFGAEYFLFTLNASAVNPVYKLFEHNELANFVETFLNPWKDQSRSIGHGLTAYTCSP
jgi:hypothetical protein